MNTLQNKPLHRTRRPVAAGLGHPPLQITLSCFLALTCIRVRPVSGFHVANLSDWVIKKKA